MLAAFAQELSPQSNQRGIETRINLRDGREARSLNRTSVGLKHASLIARSLAFGPQSNQRGIETEDLPAYALQAFVPQSNQRGIETPAYAGEALAAAGASIEPAWD